MRSGPEDVFREKSIERHARNDLDQPAQDVRVNPIRSGAEVTYDGSKTRSVVIAIAL